ncbi:unnamed protein product, partial [Phaeothamnion confervicola]
PGVEAFTAVLAGYAERGDKARAVALFQRMGEAGVRPNLVTYTALITACVNCGDVDDARRLLAALEQRGLTDASLAPTVVTYNSLITGLCQATPAEGVHEALQLLLTMRRKGVAPNEVTMNAILDGLVSAAPPRMKEAEAVVGLMRAWGLVPSEVSYSTLIKGYGRAGDLPAAERAFAAMLADMRTCADVAAVNCLLDACAKNGDMKRAVELLEEVCAAASARRRHSGGVGGSGGGGGG